MVDDCDFMGNKIHQFGIFWWGINDQTLELFGTLHFRQATKAILLAIGYLHGPLAAWGWEMCDEDQYSRSV